MICNFFYLSDLELVSNKIYMISFKSIRAFRPHDMCKFILDKLILGNKKGSTQLNTFILNH